MGFIDPAALALGFAVLVLMLWAPGVPRTPLVRQPHPEPSPARRKQPRASGPVVPLARRGAVFSAPQPSSPLG